MFRLKKKKIEKIELTIIANGRKVYFRGDRGWGYNQPECLFIY
jgi:hypothetical protein